MGKGSGHYMTPFSESWQAIWDLAIGQKALYARRSASRLMHFCSAQQISPNEVDDDVAARLLGALIEESLVLNPRERWKGILRAWNRLADLLPSSSSPNSPYQMIAAPIRSLSKEFPKRFQSEVEAAIKRWSGSDLLDEDAPEKPLAPATLKKRRIQLRELASGLVLSGWDISSVNSIAVACECRGRKDHFTVLSGKGRRQEDEPRTWPCGHPQDTGPTHRGCRRGPLSAARQSM